MYFISLINYECLRLETRPYSRRDLVTNPVVKLISDIFPSKTMHFIYCIVVQRIIYVYDVYKSMYKLENSFRSI